MSRRRQPSAKGFPDDIGQSEEAPRRKVLAQPTDNVEAAHLLGIDQATLYRKRKRTGWNGPYSLTLDISLPLALTTTGPVRLTIDWIAAEVWQSRRRRTVASSRRFIAVRGSSVEMPSPPVRCGVAQNTVQHNRESSRESRFSAGARRAGRARARWRR